jgi:hypothetical protein
VNRRLRAISGILRKNRFVTTFFIPNPPRIDGFHPIDNTEVVRSTQALSPSYSDGIV